MLFYSEKLKKFFDSAEECTSAEDAQEKKEIENKNQLEVLKAKVAEAENNYKNACKEHAKAEERAEELSKRYMKELDEILIPAEGKVGETYDVLLKSKQDLKNYLEKEKKNSYTPPKFKWINDIIQTDFFR